MLHLTEDRILTIFPPWAGAKAQEYASLGDTARGHPARELHMAAGTKERCRLAAIWRRWKTALYEPENWQVSSASPHHLHLTFRDQQDAIICFRSACIVLLLYAITRLHPQSWKGPRDDVFEISAPTRFGRQEIELNTGDFKGSSAFAEGLLSCAARAGQ